MVCVDQKVICMCQNSGLQRQDFLRCEDAALRFKLYIQLSGLFSLWLVLGFSERLRGLQDSPLPFHVNTAAHLPDNAHYISSTGSRHRSLLPTDHFTTTAYIRSASPPDHHSSLFPVNPIIKFTTDTLPAPTEDTMVPTPTVIQPS